MDLEKEDVRVLKEIQDGIPLEKEPYRRIARKAGIGVRDLLDRLKKLRQNRVIRRFGASVNHRKLGYRANAMVVWNVPDGGIGKIGEKISEFEEVTHCYQRIRYPGKWEYNLYSMVHAASIEECEEIIHRIAREVGIGPDGYEVLYSTRAFKRRGVRL
ncbi:hypothetical protein AKJ48_03980 [candidate division MSBL1 archaeon SCGC-AAA261O19]|uniref:siroheme decarboxylase n=1 Tax=candidate division MSBL1 archaeon SCGC-AAA261O19 TaxID=1698277 RepID=A0A133VA62_9EURY|nr:hypothetical protein AKJ48_03980 [candidate division MSBL1 archaeon SCGC-AAA261O19]